MNKYISLLTAALAALLLSACEQMEDAAQGVPATIKVTTAPMTIEGEQVPYGMRATEPLMPEYENSIYSLAVLVFDKAEGVLHTFPAESATAEPKYYKYINLRDANGNGLLSTTLPTTDLPVTAGYEYTVCLIANLAEEVVDSLVDRMFAMGGGAALLPEFKEMYVTIPYIMNDLSTDEDKAEMGHVSEIYMFGYYEGRVDNNAELSITLGRIIARLEVGLTVDADANTREGYSYYCSLGNVESSARLFPTGVSPGFHLDDIFFAVPTLATAGRSTLYFYTAPSSAQTADDALTLKLWYAPEGLTEAQLRAQHPTPNAVVQLGNDRPGSSDRNYLLNRNSVYRFNLNLVNK